MKQNYITAVLEKLQEGSEVSEVLAGLKKALQFRGHESLYAAILRGVSRVLETKRDIGLVVTTASEAEYKKLQTEIQAALKELAETKDPSLQLDPTVIGGFKIEAESKRLDQTYKTKLVSLYRNLTK